MCVLIVGVTIKEWSETKSGKRKFVCLNCVKLLGKISASNTNLMESKERFKTGVQHGEM